jgi:hypothetical protein
MMDAVLAEDMLTFLVGYSRRVPGLRCKGVRRMPADEPINPPCPFWPLIVLGIIGIGGLSWMYATGR